MIEVAVARGHSHPQSPPLPPLTISRSATVMLRRKQLHDNRKKRAGADPGFPVGGVDPF